MFNYSFHNMIISLQFIFPEAIINGWFTFNFVSVFKIALSRSIRLPTSLSKDSYMRNGISLADLLWLILAKAGAKLLKKHLFNDFWQYLRIGASFWNLNDSTHFSFPIWTWIIWMYQYLLYRHVFEKVSYRNRAHEC